jgi:hypothetical protein
MPKLILVVALSFVALALLGGFRILAANGRGRPGSYFRRESLFTPAERAFLGVLEAALPAGVRVLGKVPLGEIFGVRAAGDPGERQAARNYIGRRHVDFLLVRADTLVPLAGVVLDDPARTSADRRDGEAVVDHAFRSAGLPLVRIRARRSYAAEELARKLATSLGREP